MGSESLNLWRLRPLVESSEAEREASLGRRRLDPLPALAISLTHREVDTEPGLDEFTDEDLAWEGGRREAYDNGGEDILCCSEPKSLGDDDGEAEGGWLV